MKKSIETVNQNPVRREGTIPLKRQDLVTLTVFISLFLLFLWRARQGFSIADEAGQITTAHRYILGEGLLSDEWHVAQFMSFVEVLPMRVFAWVSKGTDGVILFFRYLYVIFQFSVSIVAYILLRKEYGYCATAVCLVNLLSFVSVVLFSFSYYTICTNLFFLSLIIIYTGKKTHSVRYILAGALIALSIACYPPFALLFFTYVLIYIISVVRGKTPSEEPHLLSARVFTRIIAGVILTAIVFLFYLLKQTAPNDVFSNFKYLLMDAEHLNLFMRFFGSAEALIKNPLVLPLLLLFLIELVDKKRIARTVPYFIVCLTILLVELIFVMVSGNNAPDFQETAYPIAFSAFPIMLLRKKKPNYLFTMLFACGLLMCLCNWLASGQGYLAATSGLNLCACALTILVFDIIRDIEGTKVKKGGRCLNLAKRACAVAAACLICLCSTGIYVMIRSASFFENTSGSFMKDNEKIDRGPYYGIYTTQVRKETYNKILDDLDYITNAYDGRIFVADAFPWIYLYVNRPYGAFSSWILKESLKDDPRMGAYYSAYPENIPEIVYVPKVDRIEFDPEDETDTIETVKSVFVCTVISESEVGYILRVEGVT